MKAMLKTDQARTAAATRTGGCPTDVGTPGANNGRHHPLSAMEARLLRYLRAHPGRVVTRDELLQQVWGLNPDRMLTRTVDMHIAHLRGKLGDDARRQHVVRTIYGHGYIFETH